ncbi:Uncharacterised protein [uncultured archaeon]|nr:Uncharacterised protein [uncultured archaeon]
MPDVCGFWDRRADDPRYSHTTSNGVAIYKYRGREMTYDEREKLKAESRENKRKNKLESLF